MDEALQELKDGMINIYGDLDSEFCFRRIIDILEELIKKSKESNDGG